MFKPKINPSPRKSPASAPTTADSESQKAKPGMPKIKQAPKLSAAVKPQIRVDTAAQNKTDDAKLKPMAPLSNRASNETLEEESSNDDIAEAAYTNLLQHQLMALIVSKQRKQREEQVHRVFKKTAKETALQGFSLKSQIEAFTEILQDLEGMKDIQEVEVELENMMKLMKDDRSRKQLQAFEQELSAVLDKISVTGCQEGSEGAIRLKCECLNKAKAALQGEDNVAFELLKKAVQCGMDVVEVMKLFSHDEEEMNMLMRKLASLKLCQQLAKSSIIVKQER